MPVEYKEDFSRYAKGSDMTHVINTEADLREKANEVFDRRLLAIEDRLCIVDPASVNTEYPKLVEAYKRFREEEEIMQTFEALRNSK